MTVSPFQLLHDWMPYVAVGVSLFFWLMRSPASTPSKLIPGAFGSATGSANKKNKKSKKSKATALSKSEIVPSAGSPLSPSGTTKGKGKKASSKPTPFNAASVDHHHHHPSSLDAAAASSSEKTGNNKRESQSRSNSTNESAAPPKSSDSITTLATPGPSSHHPSKTTTSPWTQNKTRTTNKRGKSQASAADNHLDPQDWPAPISSATNKLEPPRSLSESRNCSSSSWGSNSPSSDSSIVQSFPVDPVDGSMRIDGDDDTPVRARVVQVVSTDEGSTVATPVEDGWQVVDISKKVRAKTLTIVGTGKPRPVSTAARTSTTTADSSLLSKTQRKNIRKAELAKTAKDEAERLQKERLLQHRRAQESEQLQALANKSRDAARQRALDRNY
ncbi:hypothetical protein BASA50_001613 [Batrachochytrium salamandrivorans]|uniref:Uncharacterized protein n=1 Tax=Batrachochytrium salamandrivorans TaxID=1357716 RepID=A0ABQ8FNP7_9FUNG|nr:hypothetical protein BASA60_010073 [Batrachochytrium salamandrivorans]KAH6601423.1 hypothetical protein BASA50_001613 [Batrachochytrium salamandrivorans]